MELDLDEMSAIYHNGDRVTHPKQILAHIRNFLALQYRPCTVASHDPRRAEA